MKNKRIISLLLASVVAASALAGCGSGETDEGTAKEAGGGGEDGPMELLQMVHNTENYNEDQEIRKKLEEEYNIKIKVEQIPDEKDAITLRKMCIRDRFYFCRKTYLLHSGSKRKTGTGAL